MRIVIYGATGYGGQELLRYLAGHPRFEVAAVVSRSNTGRSIGETLPQLDGFYGDLRFQSPDEQLPRDVDGAFLAVPHGTAADLVAGLPDRLRIVDLSMDFRSEQDGFVYGLTETTREQIRGACRVANPGCFATGALLALAPLYGRGTLAGDVVLAQTTGSSGSGAREKPTTHHPERAQDMRAYKVLAHQHLAEMEAQIGGGCTLSMIPQSGPFSRGIFTVAHVRTDLDIVELYREHYKAEPFVRMRDDTPALRHVVRTNFCDLTVHVKDGRAVILSAIDNLGKGMAGQAIQNMNLLFGLEETEGLLLPGTNP